MPKTYRTHRQRLRQRSEGLASAVIMQLNDVYHIDFRAKPLRADSLILPRVATMRKRIDAGNKPIKFCVPGDFLAPSGLSRHSHGMHMVKVFKALGVTDVTFGNHEFEPLLGVNNLHACIQASADDGNTKISWISSNIQFPDSWSYPSGPILPWRSIEYDGYIPFRLFLTGITENESKYPFPVKDPIETAHEIERFVVSDPPEDRPTILVCLTHLNKEDDWRLAQQCPGFSLIMGGHDHNVAESRLVNQTVVVKALSNARTIRINWITLFHHELLQRFIPLKNARKPGHEIIQEQAMTEALEAVFASTTLPTLGRILFEKDTFSVSQGAVLSNWIKESPQRASMGLRKMGNNLWAAVYSLPLLLTSEVFLSHVNEDPAVRALIDREIASAGWSEQILTRLQRDVFGEDEKLRFQQGGLASLVLQILTRCFDPPADVAVINSGAFRIDRNLVAGESITEKTLHDMFYHDNDVLLFEVDAATIVGMQAASAAKTGTGNYLQFGGVAMAGLDAGPPQTQRLVTTEYVAAKFLGELNPIARRGEIKDVLRDHLQKEGAATALQAFGSLPNSGPGSTNPPHQC